jgi:hypothetical protein
MGPIELIEEKRKKKVVSNKFLKRRAKEYIVKAQTLGSYTITDKVDLYTKDSIIDFFSEEDRLTFVSPFYIFDHRQSEDWSEGLIVGIDDVEDLARYIKDNITFN